MIEKVVNFFRIRKNYKFIIGFVIGIFFSITGVYAASLYVAKGVYYSNDNSNLSSEDVQGAVDELAEKAKKFNGSDCPEGYQCLKKKDNLVLGDYVKLIPTKSSFTTDTSRTGDTSAQTIHPQELNLWRVINIRDDGTVEVISEYVSSVAVTFRGEVGYQNLVGYLNVLASQYENNTYTAGSRYFGYYGQMEYITDTSKFTTLAPWNHSTKDNTVEIQGGGDILYQKDYDLVNTALKTLEATKPNDRVKSNYWVASRYYSYTSSSNYQWSGRHVNLSGKVSESPLYFLKENLQKGNYSYSLRPILILKAGMQYDGVGTKEYPMEILNG